jgi:hypothetical protein
MAVYWATTITYIRKYPDTVSSDGWTENSSDEVFLDTRYCFYQPRRAFKTLWKWNHTQSDIGPQFAIKRLSGQRNSGGEYDPTGRLELQNGAFAMSGPTEELCSFIESGFTNEVFTIRSTDGGPLSVGYARVKDDAILRGNAPRTVIVIAPEKTWWNEYCRSEKPGNWDRSRIYSDTGWHELKKDRRSVQISQKIERQELSDWLKIQDKKKEPWVKVDAKYFKP